LLKTFNQNFFKAKKFKKKMPIPALNGPGQDFLEKTCYDLSNTLKFRLAASKLAKNPDTFRQPIPKLLRQNQNFLR
jgi:hypothetical protein